MHRETGTLTTSDGIALHRVAWLPHDAPPKALLVVAHGLAEHSGRYSQVAEFFTDAGYVVHSVDYRGHGNSPGAAGYVEDLTALVTDLRALVEYAQSKHPNLPTFIYGHSLGGLVALSYALSHQDTLAGVVAQAGPFIFDKQLSLLMPLAQLMDRIFPTMSTTRIDLTALSTDETVIAAYKNDPLVHYEPVSVRTAVSMAVGARLLRERLKSFKLPLLVMHGKDDTMTHPEGSEEVYNLAGSSDKTLKIYDDLRHELHNEPNAETTVLRDVCAWLDAHLADSVM